MFSENLCLTLIGTVYCLHRTSCLLGFISSGDWLTCFLSEAIVSGKHPLKITFLKTLDVCFCMEIFLLFLYIFRCKTVEQKLNHKRAVVHSQDVDISDKNYNLFGSVKGVHFNFAFKFFTVSTNKSLIRSSSWCYTFYITHWCVETGIFKTRCSRVSKSKSELLCNYCTITFYFLCCMALTVFICGNVELNSGSKNIKRCYNS